MSIRAAADGLDTCVDMLQDEQQLNIFKIKKVKIEFDQKCIMNMADILSQENARELKKFNESMSTL